MPIRCCAHNAVAAVGEWVRLQGTQGQTLNVRLLNEEEEALIERGG